MTRKSVLQFLAQHNSLIFSLWIGLGIACIHFVITNNLFEIANHVISPNLAWLQLILVAPYVPLSVVASNPFLFDHKIIFSSSFYGMMGWFLASRKKGLIAFAILLLSVLTFCVFMLSLMIYDG